MDRFFDKLGDILSSLTGGKARANDPRDPDEREAWEELNAYLAGTEPERSSGGGSRAFSPDVLAKAKLKEDYANLGIPFESSFAEVRKEYKKLLRKHHPDLNSRDPEKLMIATEITKRINVSYRRIRDHENRHRS